MKSIKKNQMEILESKNTMEMKKFNRWIQQQIWDGRRQNQ